MTDTSNPLVDSGTRASVAQTSDAQSDETGPAAPTARQSPPPTLAPGAPKIIAIGDVHGDVGATRKVLKLAGAIDDQDNWVGGKLVVVQVGDQLDRGNDEKAILLLLDVVADRAHKAGGALYVLNGNHETMNVALNFSYVTPGGWKDFADVPHVPDDKLLASFSPEKRGRVSAFRPAGPYATLLSGHNTIQVVGDNVFVHGGLLPKHVTYGIGKINKEISAWMKSGGTSPASISSEDSPVWSRHYSSGTDAADCKLAAEMLSMLNAKRIVVAHTVQSKGINAACGGKVWRVDVGLSKHYGGKPQVLVIEGDNVSIQK
ncbi:MAG: metallophosphoesterase [Myxococcales bacterium]|nr:metallophosphoesterase [Myxococcales bacterium]